jgi:threonine dehydrogenase-like Zn-dependent dehydrogenase
MRATLMYAAGDVRVENVPDPVLVEPTDALLRVLRSCICGSDLHPYHSMEGGGSPKPMGHELLGVVEDLGSAVSGFAKGDVVIVPFAWSDGTCDFCREGLQTSCRHGGFWGTGFGPGETGGGQAEAIRVPQAQGTLVKVPVGETDALLPSLLTLSDVYPTGYHCAVTAGVGPGTSVTVIGDGAVGLPAVLSAKQLGAERIILMGRHKDRTDLGFEFGATDVVPERGDEGVEKVRELTAGDGTHTVLEAVGHLPALEQALGVVRAGGTISRVGAPQYDQVPMDFPSFLKNVTLTGGVAPARAYIDRLLPDVLDGTVQPGKVFDRTVRLDDVPQGYTEMDDRPALKVLIEP